MIQRDLARYSGTHVIRIRNIMSAKQKHNNNVTLQIKYHQALKELENILFLSPCTVYPKTIGENHAEQKKVS